MSVVGVVVIGRNEGERLRRCLESVSHDDSHVVYVDSGSTDGSVELARELEADVVDLDMTIPFSAARARNEGYRRLAEIHPDVEFVQFVDGDCELTPNWLNTALSVMATRQNVAIVAGRLRERFPEASIYNQLGELEWNAAGSGEVESVGGVFMIRRQVFADLGGFDVSVVAGEEPELCNRVRLGGWHILRVDADMAWHDLAMSRFRQWWRRHVRNGYGSLDVAKRFGLPDFARACWRARLWSIWPVLVIAGGVAAWPIGLVILALWPAQMARIVLRTWRNGQALGLAMAHGWFSMLSYWPNMQGQMKYMLDKMAKRGLHLIEYKAIGRQTGK